jgi:hypothetical protein
MNPQTLSELQRQLQKVKASVSPNASSLWRRFNDVWSPLIVAVALIALWFTYQPESSRFAIPILAIFIAVRSLYTTIQNNLNKRLLPILDALLSISDDLLKHEHSENPDIIKPKRERSKRR